MKKLLQGLAQELLDYRKATADLEAAHLAVDSAKAALDAAVKRSYAAKDAHRAAEHALLKAARNLPHPESLTRG